ncbi:MAG: CooT family nickel-binding protein [Methanosarcinales archaeon]|jgi:predicted RNA-binding protein|nr:CooT family nickel-binding protein [Methanosarcinales archaeon]MCK4652113.1 CooT family nickel-binding protein [Methanosarcinales archaeon]
MCELTVMKPDRTILAEDVVYIRVDAGSIELRSILGDVTTVQGTITEIDITNEVATIQTEG